MDKRFKPLSPIEQLQQRQRVIEQIQSNPDWSFAQVLRHLRTELHLTLPEMAKLTKVAAQTLTKIEHERSSPTLATVEKILRPFGLQWRIVSH
ncbi:MAG: helix-turn-helix transcriptional regulator [Pseudomonadota bacterium]|nr:helix-turn-helix transcriptional regulator [Pseudomonadota bacterium]